MKDAVTQTVGNIHTSDIKKPTTNELLVFNIPAKQRSNNGLLLPLNNTRTQPDVQSSPVFNSRDIKSDGSFCNGLRYTPKTKASLRLTQCSNGNIHESDIISDGEDCFEDGLNYSFHADDDLWRLAEEGRLPWICEADVSQIKTSDNNNNTRDQRVVVARLFYYNEVYKVSTPVGLIRRFNKPRTHLPPWRRISRPPPLDVIPE